jgi:hypothetical protein
MANISGEGQASFRRMLLCAAMGLAVSVSLCFAQGNREAQLVTAAPEITTPFKCDSLDPKVCFDIYQRRMERIPAPIISDDQGDNGVIAAGRRLERCLSYDPRLDPFGWLKKRQTRSDYCWSSATRIR